MLPPCVSLKSGVGGTSSVRYKKFKSFSSRFHPALSAEVAVASTSASSRFVRCVFRDSVSTRIEPWKTSWMIDEPGRFVPPRSRWSWLRSQPCVFVASRRWRGRWLSLARSHRRETVSSMPRGGVERTSTPPARHRRDMKTRTPRHTRKSAASADVPILNRSFDALVTSWTSSWGDTTDLKLSRDQILRKSAPNSLTRGDGRSL